MVFCLTRPGLESTIYRTLCWIVLTLPYTFCHHNIVIVECIFLFLYLYTCIHLLHVSIAITNWWELRLGFMVCLCIVLVYCLSWYNHNYYFNSQTHYINRNTIYVNWHTYDSRNVHHNNARRYSFLHKRYFNAHNIPLSTIKEEFEDAKGVIRIRISKKDRQHNGQMKKYKKTNNDLQNIYITLTIE